MSVKETIQQNALMLIGAQEVADFTNETDNKVKVLNQFYTPIKRKLLSLRSWTFAQTRVEIEADKENGEYIEQEDYFKYKFQLPEDLIKVLTVSRFRELDQFYHEYEVRGCEIYANVPVLYIKYIFEPEDECLPAGFADLLTNALAAEICYKITGDKNNQQMIYQKVWGTSSDNLKGGLFGFYAKADAAQNPSRKMQSEPMTYARWMGVK